MIQTNNKTNVWPVNFNTSIAVDWLFTKVWNFMWLFNIPIKVCSYAKKLLFELFSASAFVQRRKCLNCYIIHLYGQSITGVQRWPTSKHHLCLLSPFIVTHHPHSLPPDRLQIPLTGIVDFHQASLTVHMQATYADMVLRFAGQGYSTCLLLTLHPGHRETVFGVQVLTELGTRLCIVVISLWADITITISL